MVRSSLARYATVGFIALAAASFAALPAAAEGPGAPIPLYPGKAPGERGEIGAEKVQRAAEGGRITQVTDVSAPTLTPYLVPKEKANGTAVVIAPGGGYRVLAWDHEGHEIAQWFNGIGVQAFVLKYRVPRREFDAEDRLPLMDAQRAVGLVRSRAAEWGVNPARIGFLGFSAGGHLVANLSNHHAQRAYDRIDSADETSAKPDFAVLIYPGGLLTREEPRSLHAALQPSAGTPPSFLVVATDDKGSLDSTLRYFTALKDAGVKSELHVYAAGGHGFGIRPRAGAAATWPERCAEWMRGLGMLPAAK